MGMKKDLQTIKNYLDVIMTPKEHRQAWQDDKIRMKLEFDCLLDSLQKDNVINSKTFENCYLYENKRHEIIMTCGSYKLKLA